MSNAVYATALVVVFLAWIFRARIGKAGTFLAGTLHAFANEYNEAYAAGEGVEDDAVEKEE